MREKFARFMTGRYGVDQLSKTLLFVSLAALLISSFSGIQVLYWIAIVLLVICYIRIFSRNITKRYAENMKYLEMTGKVKSYFKGIKTRFQQRKIYRFYKCPQCKQNIRVPKGKGKICITCPKCRTEFIKKS